ncbi:hypothetical protein N8077_03030 [Myxococcota bacterium]|nr:hypothetical protein [Myxococcota bacterium]
MGVGSRGEHLDGIEAKRIASSAAFQHEQLARQYFVLTRMAGDRESCLILLLGSEPPVKVKQISGKVDAVEVIRETLPAVYECADPHPVSLDSLLERVENQSPHPVAGLMSSSPAST